MEAFMKNHKKRTPLLVEKLEDIGKEIFEKSYRKILKKHIGKQPGVYALYKGEKLYYVGQAQELVSRIKTHLDNKHAKCWDRFSIYIAKNKKYVPDLEAVVIAVADPKGNKNRPQLAKKIRKAIKLEQRIKKDLDEQTQKMMGPTKRSKQAQSKRKSKAKITKASKSQSLKSQNRKSSLILVNLFETDKPLKANYKGQEYRAMLLTSGKVLYNGKEYDSLSKAGKVVTGLNTNGWTFWEIQDHKDNWITLRALREKSRAVKKVA